MNQYLLDQRGVASTPESGNFYATGQKPALIMTGGWSKGRSMFFEVLNFLFMFLRGGKRWKCAQVPAFIRLWMLLAGVQPVFTGFEFTYHGIFSINDSTIMPAGSPALFWQSATMFT
jgi:hypothetical protein